VRVLIVEDDQNLRTLLTDVLSSKKYAVDSTPYADDATRMAIINPYDVILLDYMLPDSNGVEVCKVLRENKIKSPVLMMSVKKDKQVRVGGLDYGADDYLAKPFEIDELLARMRSLIRRRGNYIQPIVRAGILTLNPNKQIVKVRAKRVSLSKREYMILEQLLQKRGKIVTREELIEHSWDQTYDAFSNVVDVFLYRIRDKLKKAGMANSFIQTVHGVGYKAVTPRIRKERSPNEIRAHFMQTTLF
jgi:two-component system copper resistance phosphate regulon response regulator CusR